MTSGARSQAARRIVISGYFGGFNAGDEAILSGMLRALRETTGPDAAHPVAPEITVLSERPGHTRVWHGTASLTNAPRWLKAAAVAAPPRWSPRIWSFAATAGPGVRSAIADSDLFVLGGGGLLADEIPGLLTSWSARLAFAHSRGVPTMIHAVGATGMKSAEARAVTENVLNRANVITVRDEESAECLIAAGADPGRILVTADPAFRCEPCLPDRADEILAVSGVPSGVPLAGLVFRPHFRDRRRWRSAEYPRAAGRYEREVSRLIAEIVRRGEYHPVILPFQRPMDIRFMRERIAASGADPSRVSILDAAIDPAEMIGVCGRMNLMVAMRLHAMIFATITGTPFVGINYSPKTRSFLRRADWEDRSLLVEDFRAEAALDLMDVVAAERFPLSRTLCLVADAEREKERANMAALADLLARAEVGRKGRDAN